MTDFWDKEKSLASSKPYELHEFFTGNEIEYYYTKYFVGAQYVTPSATYNIVVKGKTDSQVDTTWSDSGFFGYEVPGDGAGTTTPYNFLLLDDDSIIVSFAKFSYDASNYAYLCKINSDGTLDTTWGNNGFFTRPNASAYWLAFYKILQDNDGNVYCFGGGGGSPSYGFIKIDSDGDYVKTLMSGSYTFIGAVDAVWANSTKTKVMVISSSDYTVSGVSPVNIMCIDLTTEDRDTEFTGNVSLAGCADYDGGYKIRKLSDGDFVTFQNGSPTIQKFLSDGSSLDTTWGDSGTLDIGTFAWQPVAERITIFGDYIYCIANQTIEATINNIIYKIDANGTIEKQYNIASGSNSCYHCILYMNNKLVLGTTSAAPANYNIEFWSTDLEYESGFDIPDGIQYPDVIYTLYYDTATRYFGDYIRTDTWRYADAPRDVIYNDETYTACYVKGEKIEKGTNIIKSRTSVKTDWRNPFAWQYTISAPNDIVHYRRYRGQGDDVQLVFQGDVIDVVFRQTSRQGDRYTEITIESARGTLKKMGLVSRYSRQCTVELYSEQCGVVRALYAEEGTLDSVSSNVLTSTTFGGHPDGYWLGGDIIINSRRSKIIAHSGNNITILPHIYGLKAGDSFDVAPGCDHLLSTCHNKYNNRDNFRGQPNLPSRSPWSSEAIRG